MHGHINFITRVLILFICSFLISIVPDDAAAKDKKKVLRINWESVEIAKEYRVQIADSAGSIVIDKNVTTSYIDFKLSPGVYRIRIGIITKFGKPGAWSDWEEFNIAIRIEPTRKFLRSLRISFGIPFQYLFPAWSNYYSNSSTGGMVTVGYEGDSGLMRYLGLETEALFIHFRGKNDITALGNLMLGINLVFNTNLDFPLNLIARAGGGSAHSRLIYYDLITDKKELAWYTYPYIKTGLALEYNFYRNYFLESGINYNLIFFKDEQFKTLEFFLKFGLRTGFTGKDEKKPGRNKKRTKGIFPEVRIALGMQYSQVFPEWNKYIDNSPAGYSAALGMSLPRGFMKYFGFEVDTAYAASDGKDPTKKFSWSLLGGNLLFLSRFEFPLNAILRLGGGVAFSHLEYEDAATSIVSASSSEDPYFRVGIALEYNFYKNLFLEAGSNYTMIFLQEEHIKTLDHFIRIGFKTGGKHEKEEKEKTDHYKIKAKSGPVVRLAAGGIYSQVLPEWNSELKNSFTGFVASVGVIIPRGILKYTGLELESAYHELEQNNGSGKLSTTMIGGNLYFNTAFNFPLNAVLRAGGGISFSELENENVMFGETGKIYSEDPYYRFGIAGEYVFYRFFFLETGVDFVTILYENEQFKTLRYFLKAGIKL